MGSGDWFKKIISLKKVKQDGSKPVKGSSDTAKSRGFKWKNRPCKGSAGSAGGNPRVLDVPFEDLAAIRIQTAFRAYMARKTLRLLKGAMRLQILTQKDSVKKQATTTLNCLYTWSKIQAQIRAHRQSMVMEGRLRQKKLQNQLKLEAKLHDLEVEWCGGSDTREEILARIHQREEAAVKRERAMAYAFSHQWRASTSQNLGLVNYALGKANWGWSWRERWIAARPWEIRIPAHTISPKKVQSKQTNKADEVSLPGEEAKEGDEDDGDTATREEKEVIGLDPSFVDIVTVLEPFLYKHLLRVILVIGILHDRKHSGEVALPGGKREEGDADDIETALREAKEEIGLDPSLVDVVARGIAVVPVVGILFDKRAFVPSPNTNEVESIFDVPLEMFLKDENRRAEEKQRMGYKYLLHFLTINQGAKSL
ncbi:hypothetical protein GH714_015673 [Hevea brasiliensis]|uniref:Nudix hydrolase domain-containing protein n=1 Tax=Hevea brasiliensis TaxID=3981 RepID=A0A6A6LUE8_HEVBR|nr:hypothetical protein GH714_015673 [Hevea brasiliensis]